MGNQYGYRRIDGGTTRRHMVNEKGWPQFRLACARLAGPLGVCGAPSLELLKLDR